MMNQWSFEEEKRFQVALLCYPEDYPNRWENIAQVVGFSREMVFQQYHNLQTELGLVQSSQYVDSSANNQPSKHNRRSSWTLEEHTLFLLGVQKYGRGHWRNISKYAVMTRDATQVASHAQKFYIRQKERETREHARASIHDITLANSNQGYLNHLLSSRPHLVPHSCSIMQQSHQVASPVHHDIQLNQLSIQMNQESPHISSCVQLQNPHYQPNSQVVDQSLPWNQGDQYVNPHFEPNSQVVDQSLPWNQGDQSLNPHFEPNSQVVDQSLPWKQGDQFENPHYQPNSQVVDQSLPWNQRDQYENPHYQPNSQVVDQSLPWNQGDQSEPQDLYEEVMKLLASPSPTNQFAQQN